MFVYLLKRLPCAGGNPVSAGINFKDKDKDNDKDKEDLPLKKTLISIKSFGSLQKTLQTSISWLCLKMKRFLWRLCALSSSETIKEISRCIRPTTNREMEVGQCIALWTRVFSFKFWLSAKMKEIRKETKILISHHFAILPRNRVG